MPTYEFRCLKCNTKLTFNNSIHEELPIPMCCDQQMNRIWESTPAIFKGTGFYKTDKGK